MYSYVLRLIKPVILDNKALSATVLTGTLALIGLSVGFNKWRGYFYNEIQQYHAHEIYLGLVYFTILALIYVFISGLTSYYTRMLEFRSRKQVYERFSLSAQAKHNEGLSVVDQRLATDTLSISQTSLRLLMAIVDSVVRLPVFLIILWSIAKWWMVVAVVLYAILGTILSRKVAASLVEAEYQQETLEAVLRADLRQSLRDQTSLPNLKSIIINWFTLATKQKYLSWYCNFYSQVAVIFPYCMIIPMYLNHTVLLGVLFSTSAAIEEVLKSFSIFVENRDIVVNLQMQARRLQELE